MSSNISINKVCQYCGIEFVAKTTVTKFCSDDCAKRAYKLRLRTEKLEQSTKESEKEISAINLPINTKEFLNINEAGQLLGASRWTIHRLIKKGQLTVTKIGSRTIILRKSIDNLFQARDYEDYFKTKKERR